MLSFFPIFFPPPIDTNARISGKKKKENGCDLLFGHLFFTSLCVAESRAIVVRSLLKCLSASALFSVRHVVFNLTTVSGCPQSYMRWHANSSSFYKRTPHFCFHQGKHKKEKTPAVLHKISAHPRIFFFFFVYFIISWRSSFIFFFSFLELFECRHEKKKTGQMASAHFCWPTDASMQTWLFFSSCVYSLSATCSWHQPKDNGSS